ncbi:hypothetical protein RHMOL_Rhmol02G0104600 [Rhododendron molle]|uniref:Uncharacterized protein n=1 Tax=Rhododendron molle TaxID=49168 RepID=A0ACC0PQC9_RHOML|nr:hypothetical protein RHMOL_Rhmol02G0104600 [Rhododendron molle]
MIQLKKKKKEMEDLGEYESGKQEFRPVISPAASPQHSPSGFSDGNARVRGESWIRRVLGCACGYTS